MVGTSCISLRRTPSGRHQSALRILNEDRECFLLSFTVFVYTGKCVSFLRFGYQRGTKAALRCCVGNRPRGCLGAPHRQNAGKTGLRVKSHQTRPGPSFRNLVLVQCRAGSRVPDTAASCEEISCPTWRLLQLRDHKDNLSRPGASGWAAAGKGPSASRSFTTIAPHR